MSDIDTDYTDETVCPYCGYKEGDSWELGSTGGGEEDGETECGNCEETYRWSRVISVTYNTRKMP